MNVLSKLFGSASTNQKTISTISPGQFSIIRCKNSPKGPHELIYPKAELTLVKTTREFILQLQVKDLNKVEDVSEDHELEELENEVENSFLVHPDIQLGYNVISGQTVIIWKDLEGDDGDLYEFKCAASVDEAVLDEFDTYVCNSLYGQENGKTPSKGVSKSDLEKYTLDYSYLNSASKEPSAEPAEEIHEFTEGRIIEEGKADLCVFDSVKDVFISPKNMRAVNVVVLDLTKYEYFLEVRNEKSALLGITINDDLNQYVDLKTKSLIFNYHAVNGVVMSYLLKFDDKESLDAVEQAISISQYEHNNRKRWGDTSDSQKDYLLEAISGLGVHDTEGNRDEYGDDYEDYEEEEEEEDDEEVDDEDIDGDDSVNDGSGNGNGKDKNSALEIGHSNDRSYVVRGNKIGVFKHGDNNLEYSTTIENLDFDPTQIMLHERDRALVLRNEESPDKLFRMDLETGQIVNEWKAKDDISDFNPVSKFAQTTDELALLGISSASMFKIDPRIEGGKTNIDPKTQKVYKSNYGFTNVASTADGHIVTGDSTGQIRLYNKLGEIAKTLIPGLGDPIIGIDVTADGKYILATCEKYLLLLSAVTSEFNGFLVSMPKNARVAPKKLQISPENVVFMYQQTHEPIKFTPARFNTGLGTEEATIVSSTGPYLVTWNLKQILRGERNCYKIKVYKSNVTAENFQFGTDKRVIVTLENDVNMVSKNALKTPDFIFKSK